MPRIREILAACHRLITEGVVMLKLGMVDFDTSHVVQFSKRLNKRGIGEDQWVDGAEVVLGCPGTSTIFADRIPGFAKTVSEECGVRLVDKPEEMIGKIVAFFQTGKPPIAAEELIEVVKYIEDVDEAGAA
jgi:hypothetical protein